MIHMANVQRKIQEDVEINLLIEGIYQKYGYDFREYSMSSFKRRLLKACLKYNCNGFAALLHKILTEPEFFSVLLNDLTVTVTELFRDPDVYKLIRSDVIPYLRTYPEIKVWSAGCSGGEEAFSIAVMLKEEGLLNRTTIYATDINPAALLKAREGIVSLDSIRDGTFNYFKAGGKFTLNNYYMAKYSAALIDYSLRKNIVFSDHNLVTDGPFGEMQLIFCRNTMIYFNRSLQERALKVLKDGLCPGGFLCLGTKESLSTSSHRDNFEPFSKEKRIYRKEH